MAMGSPSTRAAKTARSAKTAKKPRANARKNVRKATKKAVRTRQLSGLKTSLLTLLVLVLLGASGWGAVAGWHALIARGVFQVAEIEITGNARIPEDRILARLDLPKNAALPNLDLHTVSQSVLTHPWIERATVRRIYPGTLAIRVWERTPAAVLTETTGKGKKKKTTQLMVDRDGVILGRPTADMADLPMLTGIHLRGLTAGDRVSRTRIRTGLVVAHAYQGGTPLVDVADLDDPLLLVDGMRIRLGRQGGYEWRLDRLEQLRPSLNELGGEHGAEVDLRYRDRVIARPL